MLFYFNFYSSAVHDKEKNYVCFLCNRAFTQSHSLRSHVRTVHEGARDYRCEVCLKEYSRWVLNKNFVKS